jgi:ligand-binding SRPBCC domain-containing protein
VISADAPQPTVEVSVDAGVVRVRVSSRLAAPVAEVWAVVATFAGVNAELMPYCRMVAPRRLAGRSLDSYRPGERAACWLLLGGFLPFDRHLLGLESVTPDEGFVEESTTWLQRRWRHERSLAPADGGTIVVDEVTVVPRVSAAVPVTRWAVGRVFGHRHRRLRRRFGA